MSYNALKKIVIVGGGFAGVHLVQHLNNNKKYQVTLVDVNNYNFFPPLLYQVATGFLVPSDISYPFRKLFRKERMSFRMAKVQRVDPEKRICYLDNGELEYDYLVFACGAKTNFFANEQIEANAVPMKTVEDALTMRNILFANLEKAVIAPTPEKREKLLTMVVAGAGPTGVEVSGMLAEMEKYIFRKDYPELAGTKVSIYLVDGQGAVLSPMSVKTHEGARNILEKLGVTVILNTRVIAYDGEIVKLSNGTEICTNTLIWASGITGNTFEGIPETSLGRQKRMIVNAFNEVKGLPGIYAIGDIALMTTDKAYPDGHPQQAQPAIQQGKHLAKNFKAMAAGRGLQEFIYFDKGDMAVIGRYKAVVDLFKGRMYISGILALFTWLFIHLISLVNYRNKLRSLQEFIYFDKGDMAVIGRYKAVVDLFKGRMYISGILALFTWLFIHLISLVNYRNKLRTLYNWVAAYISRDQAFRIIFRR